MPVPAKYPSALMMREGTQLFAGGISDTVIIPDSTAMMPPHSADNTNTSFLLSPIIFQFSLRCLWPWKLNFSLVKAGAQYTQLGVWQLGIYVKINPVSMNKQKWTWMYQQIHSNAFKKLRNQLPVACLATAGKGGGFSAISSISHNKHCNFKLSQKNINY